MKLLAKFNLILLVVFGAGGRDLGNCYGDIVFAAVLSLTVRRDGISH